jgi:hypothetical protein
MRETHHVPDHPLFDGAVPAVHPVGITVVDEFGN